MVGLTQSKLSDIVKTGYKHLKQKLNKGGSKMNRKQIKTNLIKVLKITSVVGSVAVGMYFDLPSLSVSNVLSLAGYTVGFYLIVRYLSK